MPRLIMCEPYRRGFRATFRTMLGEKTYYTTNGVYFYTKSGRKSWYPGLMDAMEKKYDTICHRWWDEEHPSPEMLARSMK